MPVTRSRKRKQSEHGSEGQEDEVVSPPSTPVKKTPRRSTRGKKNSADEESPTKADVTDAASSAAAASHGDEQSKETEVASIAKEKETPVAVKKAPSPKKKQEPEVTNTAEAKETPAETKKVSSPKKKPEPEKKESVQSTPPKEAPLPPAVPQKKVKEEPSDGAAVVGNVVKEAKKSAAVAKAETVDDDDDDPVWSLKRAQKEKPSRSCPYLDTIDRGVLDFDFEKLCSVSLSHLNVYACLVCGKYFQGRGTSTHAYTHSLDTGHHVYLNLLTLKFYCLPDNYEIIDPSLEDIKYVLQPTYTPEHILTIDKNVRLARAYDGKTYYPGAIGLNNIKANDYTNVILHALSHVPPLRNYFMREENYSEKKRPPGDKLALLPKRFGELIRKLWNPRAFKPHVSPHEMLQAVVLCSEKRFQITKQGDAADFINWLLNTLHVALNGTKKTSSSIIYQIFRGRMREYTRKVLPVDASEEARAILMETEEFREKMKEIPFLYLTLDLPAAPLYRDELMQNIIPQVPLSVLLQKFNGQTEKEYKTYNENFMKRFELLRLPQYLIITFKRFQKNQWFVEKNPTIVNFPISNVDLFDSLAEDARGLHKYTTYDLVANVVHDEKFASGTYRVQLAHRGTGKWYEHENLHVKEILPQEITLAESYIQIWELNTERTREERLGEGEGLTTFAAAKPT